MFQQGRGGNAMLPLDPVDLRDFWLQVRLQYTIDDKPLVDDKGLPGLAHVSNNVHAGGHTSDLVSGYLVGLSKELQATTNKHLAWMESYPEPDRAIYLERGLTNEGWLESLYGWRKAMGVSQWLGRGDRAFASLTAAAAADWQLLDL